MIFVSLTTDFIQYKFINKTQTQYCIQSTDISMKNFRQDQSTRNDTRQLESSHTPPTQADLFMTPPLFHED